MNPTPCMNIRINKCKDSLAWYANRVGQTLPVVRFEKNTDKSQGLPEDVYWCREGGTYNCINFVRASDATVMPDAPNAAHAETPRPINQIPTPISDAASGFYGKFPHNCPLVALSVSQKLERELQAERLRGAELAKDAARLDWLEKSVRWSDPDHMARIRFDQPTVKHHTLRQAIDAALTAHAEGKHQAI